MESKLFKGIIYPLYNKNYYEKSKEYMNQAFKLYDNINQLNDDNTSEQHPENILGYDNIDYANY